MKLKMIFVWFCVALLLLGCGAEQGADMQSFSEELYAPRYAEGFDIRGREGAESSLLTISRPWQGEVEHSYQLLILRGGEAAPADFRGGVIRGEAKRIVALSSSNIAMFDRVGEVDRIVGVSALDYISNPKIQEAATRGEIFDVGFDSNLNFELITLLKPDIVLLFSVAGSNNTITSKLDELRIPYLYIGDYAEESPLGKAEWMVAMAEICGARQKAVEIFDESAARYEELCSLVDREVGESRPKIMFNTPYRDVWYLPTSNSYIVQLVENAGGEYIYKGNTSNQTKPISIEQAYQLLTETDIWLNTGATTNSMAELGRVIPKFMDMPVVKRGEVYNNTARNTPMGGSDFWESGVVYPEVILEDLIEIIHPELLEHDLYYYKKLK